MSIKLEAEFRIVQTKLDEVERNLAALALQVDELTRLLRAMTRESTPQRGKAA